MERKGHYFGRAAMAAMFLLAGCTEAVSPTYSSSNNEPDPGCSKGVLAPDFELQGNGVGVQGTPAIVISGRTSEETYRGTTYRRNTTTHTYNLLVPDDFDLGREVWNDVSIPGETTETSLTAITGKKNIELVPEVTTSQKQDTPQDFQVCISEGNVFVRNK